MHQHTVAHIIILTKLKNIESLLNLIKFNLLGFEDYDKNKAQGFYYYKR